MMVITAMLVSGGVHGAEECTLVRCRNRSRRRELRRLSISSHRTNVTPAEQISIPRKSATSTFVAAQPCTHQSILILD